MIQFYDWAHYIEARAKAEETNTLDEFDKKVKYLANRECWGEPQLTIMYPDPYMDHSFGWTEYTYDSFTKNYDKRQGNGGLIFHHKNTKTPSWGIHT